jgi:hypothetical protein
VENKEDGADPPPVGFDWPPSLMGLWHTLEDQGSVPVNWHIGVHFTLSEFTNLRVKFYIV